MPAALILGSGPAPRNNDLGGRAGIGGISGAALTHELGQDLLNYLSLCLLLMIEGVPYVSLDLTGAGAGGQREESQHNGE
jgi:hypothetical protein